MISRRNLIRQSAAAAPMALLPDARRAWAGPPNAKDDARLIVLFLRGAADALNIVVPYAERAYYAARPRIAIPAPGGEDGALDLDGRFGLHPALADMMPLWRDKSLAFIHACGSPDPSRSHFDAQSFMETGTPGVKSTNDGWMNRLLQILAASSPGTQAAAFQPTVPLILAGDMPVRAVAPGGGQDRSKLLDDPSAAAALARLYAKDDALALAYRQARDLGAAAGSGPDAETIMADNGAPPPGGLPHTAAVLAKRMRDDPSIRLAFLSVGGWDTHTAEGGAQGNLANNLRKLGEALGVLARDLGPLYRRSVIVVMSEFGRALREDGGGGTDHGHGSAMWLLGGAVAGGKVYGDWPGLDEAALHDGRDLAITTDFRSAIGAVIRDHLGVGAGALPTVFPGMPTIDRELDHLIV
jgi:uncharacterized protein (DUF1501 family)